MLPLFGVRRFGQPSAMVEPLPSGLINPMGLGGTLLNPACFSFTGSNYASIAALSTNILGGQGDFTISAMGQSTGFNGVAAQRLFSAYGGATNQLGLNTPTSSSQRIQRFFVAANDGGYSTTTSDATVGAWLRYTYVWAAAAKTMTLFLGTTSISTRVYASLFGAVAATQFFLGALNDGASRMTGAGADFRVYNVAKTVDAAWLAGLLTSAHDTTGLVAWYPYPNTSGVARDCSGNGNHMTTTGGSLYSASGGPGLPWWPV